MFDSLHHLPEEEEKKDTVMNLEESWYENMETSSDGNQQASLALK